MFTSFAKKKAAIATVGFSVFGLGSSFLISNWYVALPLLIFYAILILNTYFSIRCLASITPRDNQVQGVVDVILALSIFAQAASLNYPLLFICFAIFLFVFATFKYTLLYSDSNHKELLERKMKVDILGAIACSLALWGGVAGYSLITTWLLVASFLAANFYLFFIKPLYVIKSSASSAHIARAQ